MALDFDTRSAPRRPADLVTLAEAVFEASIADEFTWLEWKSTLDLASKHGCHHIARAIIGFANRMPDEAARFTEGCAYVVVGIEPNSLAGITPIDVVDLDKGLTPYLGTPGPRWRPTYVTVTLPSGSAQVLIVEVEAPRWGDPIFCMHKELEGVAEGTIFVRGPGVTRRATARDLAALEARVRRGAQQIEAEVLLRAGAPVRPIDSSEDAVGQWLQQEERAVMASLLRWEREQRRQNDPAAEYAALQARTRALGQSLRPGVMREIPEDRSPQEYREQVAGYLERCADSWAQALAPGAAAHVTPIELELHNLLAANLAEVEVRLYVPGDVQAVRPRPAELIVANENFVPLPARPRPFGPRQASVFDESLYSAARTSGFSMMTSRPTCPAVPRIENGGSVTITFPPVHLRPDQRVRLDPIVLVVDAPAPSIVLAEWWATSTSMNGTAYGQLPIPIASDPLPLAVVLTEPDTWRKRRDNAE
ncbi:hypothetical protein [Streptosporangium sp. NPDC000396]|uniref:hypothetical protein n=1 Tax=Streptosporangium sp. NPDC000396 TaxID=3366185 RepID=UPI0036AA1ADC